MGISRVSMMTLSTQCDLTSRIHVREQRGRGQQRIPSADSHGICDTVRSVRTLHSTRLRCSANAGFEIQEVQRWIMSFGPSATVLEPVKLNEEIRADLTCMLEADAELPKSHNVPLRPVMSERIGERHASACRYKNEIPNGSRPMALTFIHQPIRASARCSQITAKTGCWRNAADTSCD